MVVAAGGRVGTCDVLRFTPQGEHLLAAGDDKVVWVWPHSADGLDTDPQKHPHSPLAVVARSARRHQGMAVSPDGKRVAIGGYGLRISSVAILDRESGETLAITWPNTYEGGAELRRGQGGGVRLDRREDRLRHRGRQPVVLGTEETRARGEWADLECAGAGGTVRDRGGVA